jgi:hypothetical protein
VTNVSGAGESAYLSASVNPALLREGVNVLAAEIHQANTNSVDISFDLELLGAGAPRDTMFLQAEPVGAGLFRLWFTAQFGRSYVIESSSDLETWSPVSTNPPVDAIVEYMEVVPGPGHRFFRARLSP